MLGHQVQKILGAPDRERRNQDIALCGAGGLENAGQLRQRVLDGPVQTITIGAFHQYGIRPGKPPGGIHQRRIAVAEVATENERA